MRIERLGDLGSAPEVLRVVASMAAGHGLPPPAALIGEWFGSGAVIAPSVAVTPVDVADGVRRAPQARPATRSAADGSAICPIRMPGPTGADRGFPRRPAAGRTACCARTATGRWWYESLSGAPISGWVAEALRPSPHRRFEIDWGDADRDAHRARRAGLPGGDRCGRGLPGVRVHTVRRHGSTARRSTSSSTPSTRTSPARAAYVAGDWGAVASLSPELFLRRRGEAVTSSPIKGTLPRHADPSALRASVKDVAENIMIVDLVRNDLGRVAVTGSVTVPELLVVRPAPGVWHLVSTVSARVGRRRADGSRARRDVPARFGDRHAEDAGPPTADQLGAGTPRSLLRHSRFGVAGRGLRTERGDPYGRVRRLRQRGAWRRRRHHRRFRPGS